MTAIAHIYGTPERDIFVFDFDSDTIDVVYAGGGRDRVGDGDDDGYWSSDAFYGQAGADTLISNDGNDALFGGAGRDHIFVAASTSGFEVVVHGGRGDDTLTISNSAGATVENDDGEMLVHTRFGGTITVHGIEHLLLF